MNVTVKEEKINKVPYFSVPEGVAFRECADGTIYLKVGYNNNYAVQRIDSNKEICQYHITLPIGEYNNPPVFGSFTLDTLVEIIPSGAITVII